jgi:Tfp pilus assembly protein PilF
MHYKKTRLPLPQIARELGVDGIVEGSVVRSGSRVRISSQLILASTDQHLWARSYERDLSDIVGLQGEVAQAIAAQVRAAITQQQRYRLDTIQPVDREAYDLYLQGQFHLNQFSPAGTREAIAHFRQAVQKDPGFALAYANLAIAYETSSLSAGSAPKETFPLAREAAERALQLDPLLPDAHTALAIEESVYRLDRSGAEKEFLRAIQLNPNSVLARRFYAGSYLKCVGKYQEALAEARKAVGLDPFSLSANEFLALMYMFAGDNDRSLQQFRHLIELDPNHGRTRLLFAVLLARLGRYPESIEEFQKGEILSGTPPEQAVERAAALRKAARSGRASDYWRGYLKLGLESIGQRDQAWFGPTDIAEAYAQLGNNDKAFEWLEKAYQDREGIPLSALNCDPGFKNLHGDPRFADLMRRLHLRE